MARPFQPQIATANDLLLGDVVYLTADGQWSRTHGDAAVATTKEAAEALLKRAEADAALICGAYLAPAELDDDGRPQPTHFREIFRTTGPTFWSGLNKDFGKQPDKDAA